MPRRKLIKRTILFAGVSAVAIAALQSDMNYMQLPHERELSFVSYGKTVYKTIPCSDSATELIGFELHKKYIRTGNTTRTEYNVVMRDLDPRVDTYKTYCHDIIADLSEEIKNDPSFAINVFDSFEAYSFYAEEAIGRDADEHLLAEHLVATYEMPIYGDEREPVLTYYPYAGTMLRETGSYN
ncbi:hypothetical protein GCM10023093_13900 [Nemorincola caseinilytica]|uniref:Uncharacterized protein n=1 Tax=Nemorincola caseinilytica TaxID=2054315 RepID=A0ABP8NAM6_9BACT